MENKTYFGVIVNGRDGNLVDAASEHDAISKVIEEYKKRRLSIIKIEVYHLLPIK